MLRFQSVMIVLSLPNWNVHIHPDFVDDNLRLHFYVDYVKAKRKALSFYGLRWTLRQLNIPQEDHHLYFGCGDYFK